MNLHGSTDPSWAQLIWSGLTHMSVPGADRLGQLCTRCLSSSSWKLQASPGMDFLHQWQKHRGLAPVYRPVSSPCLQHICKHSICQANHMHEFRIKEQERSMQLGWGGTVELHGKVCGYRKGCRIRASRIITYSKGRHCFSEYQPK